VPNRLNIASRAAVAVLAAAVGFLLVTQFRGQERFTQRLEAESEGDLARILASLNTETDSLREEIASLKLQLLTLQTSSARDAAAVKAAREQLTALEVLAGTSPAHGAGVVVRIEDASHALRYDTFVDIVQELRDAGAEAIAINDHRVGVQSAFTQDGDRAVLDGARLDTPYRVVAIGAPDTLDAGLAIPGGVVDTLTAAKGVKVTVNRQADVEVPALESPPSFRAARPVTSDR
jgi:uncharacterized protein YlxW (UPF0749 family)